MKALVKKLNTPGLSLIEKEIPKISNPDQVIIKVNKAAICGTDLHIYKWDKWAQNNVKLDTTIGHEFIGVIQEIGSNVYNLKIGDRVCTEGHITCNTCRHCLRGDAHECPNTLGIGVNTDGAFANYIIAPKSNVIKINKSIPDNIAAIFDPLGNAIHTCLAFPCVAEDILITGAGPIGIMAALICQKMLARNVLLVDINKTRLDLAKKSGVKLTSTPENIDKMKGELNIIEGFDIGLEMSGSPNGFDLMVKQLVNGGKIAQLGIMGDSISFNLDEFTFKSLTMKGIYGRKIFETWYQMQVLAESIDFSKIITHEFSLADYKDAFETALSGNSGKILLNIAE